MRRFIRRFRARHTPARSSRRLPKPVFWIGMLLFVLGISLWWQYRAFFLAHSQEVPAPGGQYTESVIGTIRNLNPLATDSSLFDRDLHQLIFRGLLQYNPASGQVEDALASLRISDDGKTYFLTLKNTARFQNGSRVTIHDVLFTYEQLIQNPHFANPYLREAFEYVTINTIDEQTVSFQLLERNVFFPTSLTVPILPQKSFENALIEEITDPDYPFNQKPIGAGPYKIDNLIREEDGTYRVFLTPNKYYYGEPPKIDQIVFYVYPTFETLQTLHTKTLGYTHIPVQLLPEIKKELSENTYSEQEYLLPRFMGLFFNLDRPIVSNLYFRKAILSATPKEKLLEKEIGWQKIDSPFFFDGVEGIHDYNLIESRRILRDAEFPYIQEIGHRTQGHGGDPVVLRMITSTAPPVYSRFAQNIARTWEKELGITIRIDILDPIEFQDELIKREYDIVLFGENYSRSFDPFSTWHSSQTGKVNLANLTNQSVDFLISELRFSGAQSDLIALNEKLDHLVPAIILATPQYKLLITKDVQGFSEHFGKIRSHAQRFSGIEYWYFQTALDWDWPENKSRVWGFLQWVFGNKDPLNRNSLPDETPLPDSPG